MDLVTEEPLGPTAQMWQRPSVLIIAKLILGPQVPYQGMYKLVPLTQSCLVKSPKLPVPPPFMVYSNTIVRGAGGFRLVFQEGNFPPKTTSGFIYKLSNY